MKKLLFFLIALIILISFVSSIPNLEIEKIDRGSVIIAEPNNPAIFDFKIDNKGGADNFQIYSLVGVSLTPIGTFNLPQGISTIEVQVYPSEEIKKIRGFTNFEYQLKGRDSGIFKDTIEIKIVPLEETLEIDVLPISPGDKNATLVVKNRQNANLNNLEISLESPFFEESISVSLKPLEQKEISLKINKEDSRKLTAGSYVFSYEIKAENAKAELSGLIDYLEKEGTSVNTNTQGIIIRKTTITKTNQGNTETSALIEIKKGIISRLFTTNSPNPTLIDRTGLSVNYIWEKPLAPQESLEVKSTTNYTIPFIMAILIVIITFLVKIYSQTPLTITKKVSPVKTKGGEFAVKVTLKIKTRKHVDKIQLIDTLPRMTRLFEKFGKKPDKIDHNSGRLFWNVDRLSKGEERVYSYIIYSKLNVVGRFELPSATAIYEHEGKTLEVFSHKAFLVSENSNV